MPGQIAFEEQSVAGVQTGDCDRTLAELVYRHAQFLFRVAYSVLRKAHDAEDVVQETFLKIHRSGHIGKIANERAYIARTAFRIAVDLLPKRKREPASGLAFAFRDAESLDSGGNPEDQAMAAAASERIHRLIESLPPDLRLPLALSSIEDLKSQEIAAIMGIPEGTVRRRLMRARQALKTKLSALGVRDAK